LGAAFAFRAAAPGATDREGAVADVAPSDGADGVIPAEDDNDDDVLVAVVVGLVVDILDIDDEEDDDWSSSGSESSGETTANLPRSSCRADMIDRWRRELKGNQRRT
jgi:hypothetical protein